ncbi:testis-expressed protein 13D [Tupaia chinensis]|uniref:testis-expressed protein 13D n=1 Tax=Tupaia chinensis TaxID=246437 RepID=UPI0003C8D662|nr:testis-expressed protein 13D [Tupaia chinensis]
MAVNFQDPESGFRHSDVILFINQEVINNGGGPEFYLAFRSQPWEEIEDCLQLILTDPHVPRSFKRACAWNALALSVRMATRQREQMEERDAALSALASELQQLREEHEDVVWQLQCVKEDLHDVLDERNMLHWQLLQVQRLAQARADPPPQEENRSQAVITKVEAVTGASVPPGQQLAAAESQEETGQSQDQKSQGQREALVWPVGMPPMIDQTNYDLKGVPATDFFRSASRYNRKKGGPKQQQSQGQVVEPPTAPGTSADADEAPASNV